ncbi:MAG TPA: histidine kinase dimerization/phospho-acceptor domain-containing protein, partial [Pedococcus sp.]|nr:histidine kinase dimerization/phospho-acceptor domain-containing protein [Pedococcus sp.]
MTATDIDPIRALCHDLRQPLAAILLLSASGGGDVSRKLQVILDQAQWLSQLVDTVLCDAAHDEVTEVDVAEIAEIAVTRARPTA